LGNKQKKNYHLAPNFCQRYLKLQTQFLNTIGIPALEIYIAWANCSIFIILIMSSFFVAFVQKYFVNSKGQKGTFRVKKDHGYYSMTASPHISLQKKCCHHIMYS